LPTGRFAAKLGAMTDGENLLRNFTLKTPLEELLEEASADPARRPAFETMLLHTDLYAATPDASGTVETHIFLPGDQLRLRNVTLQGGKQVPALFTSEQRVTEFYGDGAGFVTMKGRPLLELVAPFGAALNPGFAHGVLWTPDQLASLLGRPVSNPVTRDMAVGLGMPDVRPERLIAALTERLSGDDRVQAAWLGLTQWPEREEVAWYLDIASEAGIADLRDLIAETVRADDLEGRRIDVAVNPPGERLWDGIRIK